MFVTNGKKITVQNAQDEEQLENFCKQLFESFNREKGLTGAKGLKPKMETAEESGLDRMAVSIPKQMGVKFVTEFGCVLGALYPEDIIVKQARESKDIKYVFSEEEQNSNSNRLANAVHDIVTIKNDLKKVQADYGAKIKAAEAQQTLLANYVTSGYMISNREVDVHLDFANNIRNYVDPTSGKVLGTEPFTKEDFQLKMF